MNEFRTKQRQIQEQQTTIRGGGIGGGGGQWVSSVIRAGLFLLFVTGFLLWRLWQSGFIGQAIDVLLAGIVSSCVLWYLYQWGKREGYKTRRVELETHFYSHPQMVIGDYTTHEYKAFYVPVVQEYIEAAPTPELPEYASTITTLSQNREKAIQDRYYGQNMSMADIVKEMKTSAMYDAPSMHDVRKALGKLGKE